MEIEFPVFIETRDSGEIKRYGSLREMARSLERIDVENEEYAAWDRSFRKIRLRVRQGEDWLELLAGDPSEDEFRAALTRFAASVQMDSKVGGKSFGSADVMFEAIQRRVAEAKAQEGWFKRLIRRF